MQFDELVEDKPEAGTCNVEKESSNPKEILFFQRSHSGIHDPAIKYALIWYLAKPKMKTKAA